MTRAGVVLAVLVVLAGCAGPSTVPTDTPPPTTVGSDRGSAACPPPATDRRGVPVTPTPGADGDPPERRYTSSPRLSDAVEERLRAVLCAVPRRATPAGANGTDGPVVVYPPPPDDEPVSVVVAVAAGGDFDAARARVGSLGESRSAFPDQRLFTARVPANRFDDLLTVPGVESVGLNRAAAPDGTGERPADTGGGAAAPTARLNRSSASRTASPARRPR